MFFSLFTGQWVWCVLQDVLSVAKFPEYDWDQHVQIWRQLDNVLSENELLTEEQMKKLGSTHRRYIRPAESMLQFIFKNLSKIMVITSDIYENDSYNWIFFFFFFQGS